MRHSGAMHRKLLGLHRPAVIAEWFSVTGESGEFIHCPTVYSICDIINSCCASSDNGIYR